MLNTFETLIGNWLLAVICPIYSPFNATIPSRNFATVSSPHALRLRAMKPSRITPGQTLLRFQRQNLIP